MSLFETQGNPIDALTLQDALSEPITLVSAHDVAQSEELASKVARFRQRGGVVFLDSGGYEASRIGLYVDGYRESWTVERFANAAEACEYDLAASYDMFIEEDQSVADFQLQFVDFLKYDHKFIDQTKLVPVILARL